jgi:hypothetical protein
MNYILKYSNLFYFKPRNKLIVDTGSINQQDDNHLAIEMTIFESAFLCGLISRSCKRVYLPGMAG